MRYEDASQAGSNEHSDTVARPDVDTLPAGSFGPATGNAITGQGTSSGSSGADSVGAGPATVVAVQGAGGQTVAGNGSFQASGQYGVLQMDAQGNFNYVRNPNTPDGVKDVFNYTLADAAGANASTTLTIDIVQVAAAAAGQGVVALPAGVELSDIHVNGRDLVINMPDGTQMVIPNGAVFVPEISIGDVQVPPTNIAALLVDSEPQPAAGPPPSSGGNWNDPVPPLDPGVPLGDLIPPTELGHTPPQFQEPAQGIDTEPSIIIETPDFPAGAVNASESVFEKGLPTRNGGEPAGSGEIADGNASNNSDGSESNTGTIVFTAQDGLDNVTINGTAVTGVGQHIQGQFGTMTITGINLNSGQITYSYTLGDNTSGDNTHDVFTIVVTDHDGDTATGTLTVNIVDDVPTALNDTDSVDLQTNIATGNVVTGAGTTSGAKGADTVGADNAHVTGVSSNGTAESDTSFDQSGNLLVHGDFGTLTIKADGSYTYTPDEDARGGSTDVFTYTLTDGDGDSDTATLTITNNANDAPTAVADTNWTAEDSASAATGNVLDTIDHPGAPSGTFGDHADTDPENDTLTVTTVNGDASNVGNDVVGAHGTLHLNSDGTYGYLVDNADAAVQALGVGETTTDTFTYTVSDGHGGTASASLTITIFGTNDAPAAVADTNWTTEDSVSAATGNVLETHDHSGAPSGTFGDHADSDTDAHDTLTVSAVNGDASKVGDDTVGVHGTLHLNSDGSYSYLVDNTDPAVQALGAGETTTDTFTYTVSDGHGGTDTASLTITIFGTNDAPEAVADTNWTTEDSASAASGNVLDTVNHPGAPSGSFGDHADSDSDASDTLAVSAVNGDSTKVGNDVLGAHGTLHLNSDGSYTYQVNNADAAVQALGVGETTTDTFSYTASDGHGGTSTANLTITIFGTNDVPSAVADTNWTTDDSVSASTGNVLETHDHSGAPSGTFGDHADSDPDAHDALTVASVDGSAANVGNDVVGDHGTLHLNSDGSYSYLVDKTDADVIALGNADTLTDSFTYSVSDGHGGTASTTLTITIFGTNDPPSIGDAIAHVSEEGLASFGAIADDNGFPTDAADTTDSATVLNGHVTVSDPNAGDTLTVTLSNPPSGVTVDGQPVTWSLSNNDHTLSASVVLHGVTTPVMTITINDSGDYAVTLQHAIDHPNTGGEDVTSFDVQLNVSDGGSTDTGTLTISVEDDSPTITHNGEATLPSLVTDDTNIPNATDGPTSYAGLFTGSFGADGFKDANNDGVQDADALRYGLSLKNGDGTDSGLIDTLSNDHILLRVNASGDVEGYLQNSTSTIAFTIDLNPDTGTISLEQDRAIVHDNPADPVESGGSAATIAADLIVLTATIEDADGDTASANANIGNSFHFEDDGPHAAISTSGFSLSHDETAGLQDSDVAGPLSVFAGVTNTGDDPDVAPASGPIGYATSTGAISSTGSTFGADGFKDADDNDVQDSDAVKFSLDISNHAGVDSSLNTTDGTNIFLFLEDGLVVGRVGANALAAASGVAAFAIAIDPATGQASMVQYLSIEHTNTGSNDESAPITNGAISAVVTVTDGDGDTSSTSTGIGSLISFQDDGPTASATLNSGSTVTLDESGPGAAATIGLGAHTAGDDEDVSGSGPISRDVSGSAVITPNVVYGADGAAANQPAFGLSVTNASSGLHTTEGEAITLTQLNSTTILGIVAAGGEHANEVAFAIQIGADGKVTVEQYLSLDHPINPNPDDVVMLGANTIAATVSATDGDGDTITSAPVDISGQISFHDDGPTLGAFDEANIDNAVGHVDGTYAFNWGADGFGGLTVTGTPPAGVTYTTTTAADGSVTVHGNSGATELFNLVVHPDGTYTFNLVTPDAGSTETHTLLNIASGQNEFIQTPDGVIEFTPLDHNGVDTGTVNSSGAGFGNGNQFTGNGEAVTFEFHSTNDAGNTDPNTHPNFVSEVKLDVPSNGFNGSTETITWFAKNTETNQTATGTIQVDSNTNQLVFDPGFDFNVLTIEGSNADGNGIRMTQITTTTTILPQDLDLSFTIHATDGDGDPTGNSTLNVHINADDSSTLAAPIHTQSLMSTLDTHSLVATNDNGGSQTQRSFAVGQSTALMGALAAAGLEADHSRHELHGANGGGAHAPSMDPLNASTVVASSLETHHSVAPTNVVHDEVVSKVADAPQGGSHFQEAATLGHGSDHAGGHQAPAITELLHGSAAPTHGPAASAAGVTATTVAMPSAQQLAAAAGANGGAKPADGAQHNEVVGKVLADSLHGGEGHGPNIDALLSGNAGQGGGHDVLEALASHAAGAVPFGHTATAAAFAGSHAVFSMMHHDAAPPAHG